MACMQFETHCCGAGDAQSHGSRVQRVTDGCSYFRPDWAAHQPHPGKRLTRQVWHSGLALLVRSSHYIWAVTGGHDCGLTNLPVKMLPAAAGTFL